MLGPLFACYRPAKMPRNPRAGYGRVSRTASKGLTMRALVLILALLAGLKVWYQDGVFREAADAAVASAYRGPAIAACQKQHAVDPVAWTNPESIHLTAGNRNIPVRFWQVDHALWTARFKKPHLVLQAAAANGGLVCTYDLASGQAAVTGS